MIKSVLGSAAGQPTMPQPLVFVTGNANKLREVQAILGSAVPSLTNRALDLPELQGSIEEITLDKARRAAAEIGGPVLVEDTCLCFNALHGLPGPYVKWFMKELGHEGLNNMLAAYDDKSAQAVCTFAYCAGPGMDAVLFEGRTDGKIVPARGPKTFGWDAVFEYQGLTYAEMDKEEKNKISHRGKALDKLKVWLAKNHC
ncbi:inosine triphosphate pyrophosphatase-like protein [Tricharina praecox]|uniref:inosine triphosphate pyrophosphatase-like protein n=1 Tax=Tricharina praecox TaxID=43433 RepID=UPI00221EDE03|nr:inosine triphosphate pyrophosphatase-like protein [Tricharina praecox]KAI5850908.1 inosine triphosphate pyrophosphatase-like protein [Tricharina praecox]